MRTHRDDAAELAFLDFLEERYPEHFQRITRAQGAARLSRTFYPVLGVLGSGLPLGGIGIVIHLLARDAASGSGVVPVEAAALLGQMTFAFWVVAGAIVLTAFFATISAGFSKARAIIFEAEQLDLAARTQWELRTLRVFQETRANGQVNSSDDSQMDISLPEVRIPGPH